MITSAISLYLPIIWLKSEEDLHECRRLFLEVNDPLM